MSGLAYVGRVERLEPIPEADRIELAEVVCGSGGRWRGVVGKGQFSEGGSCVAFLQDAVLKPCQELEFLAKANWRVKMQKFRGVPSECVVVPLHHALLAAPSDMTIELSLGDDVTELLGVTRYAKTLPANLAGEAKGCFPQFIPKTDEPNFQTAERLVEALRGKPWYATVKCDGSSTTAYRRGDDFGVCSRNLELLQYVKKSDEGKVGPAPYNAMWKIALDYDLPNKLPDGIALQWETCGPGVQKNPMGLSLVEPRAFSAWVIREGRYLDGADFFGLCNDLGFPAVEMIGGSVCFDLDRDELQRRAEGTYPNGKQREGIVIRPLREELVKGQRLSFKVINLLYKD